MIRLTFDDGAVFNRLSQAKDRLADMSRVYGDIGEYLLRSTKQRFLSGVAPDGTPWAPKKPATIARYKARGDGNRPKPLIGPSGRLGREISYAASRDAVEIGSALIYSGVMQDGAAQGAFSRDSRNQPIPWGTIPARVWLGLSSEDERNILDIVDEHLQF